MLLPSVRVCLPLFFLLPVACCFVELVASFGFWSFAKYLSFSLNFFLLLLMVTLFAGLSISPMSVFAFSWLPMFSLNVGRLLASASFMLRLFSVVIRC